MGTSRKRGSTGEINFTKSALEKLPAAKSGKRSYYRDAKWRGLVLDVGDSGTKTFRLYKKVEGRPQRILIGRFPDLSIEQARGKAHELSSKIALGENPADTKKAVRAEIKLGEMFKRYIEGYAKVRKRSWTGDEWLYNAYLREWADKRLSAIEREDVEKLNARIARKHGKYSANRTMALLSSLFNRADDWYKTGRNPVAGVRKFPEEERERFVEPDEMPGLLTALQAELDTDARDAILIMLVTGARKSNVLSMRWADLHIEKAVWRIPLTKSGKALSVVLVPFAIDLLSRRRHAASGEYVFPGRHGEGHRIEVKSAWERVRTAAKLEDVRLHDLRRTFGSYQALSNVSLHIIGKSLGHADVSTTAIYARMDLDPVRAAVTLGTDRMLAAGAMPK